VSLRYRAPLDCPNEADFVRAVTIRGGSFDAPSNAERLFEVTVAKNAAGYLGSFQVRRSAGDSSARDVHGPTCHEVVDGLAVATALALQDSRERATDAPDLHQTSIVEAPRVEVAPPPPPPDDRSPSEKIELGPAFTLTGFGGVAFGLVPGTPMPRYELALTWASLVRQANHGHIVGPLMRLGLNLYGGGTYERPGTRTTFGAQALTGGPCYAPVYSDRGLVLLTCLELTAGLIGASTLDRQTGLSRSRTLGFGSVGAGLEAAYNIGRHFHIALQAGANVLVAPITFNGPDGGELFRSSRYNGYVMLGAGGHF